MIRVSCVPACHLLALVAILGALLAAPPARADGIWFEGGLFGGAAVRGYDVVAYFTEGRPVEGSSAHSHDWMGTTWRFATAGNRDRFAADPEKFAPQYGGYCAWAVSQGYTAKIDPDAWKIVDGRLYLNYSKSVQQTWEQDVRGNVAKADENWPAIRRKLGAE